jgi:hypothetical protein
VRPDLDLAGTLVVGMLEDADFHGGRSKQSVFPAGCLGAENRAMMA